jgi:dTDP-4-amino-4,6-dideoxygalactose transaminase
MLPSNDQSTSRFYAIPSYVPSWGWAEFRIAVQCVLTDRLVQGDSCQRLRDLVRTELGLPYALTVNRARYGIQLALEAFDIGPGDDVVVPSYVCEAVLVPLQNVGANPVFAEVGPDLHVTAETVRHAITSKTKCVIVPHLFGNVAPIDNIEDMLKGTGIHLIDDAAQSFGARCAGRLVGTFGNCGVIGLGPGKSLAGPAGGLLVTRDPALFERVSSRVFPRETRMSVLRRLGAFWIWFRFRRYFLGFKRVSDEILPRENKSGDRPGRMSNVDAMLAIRQIEVWDRNACRKRRQARRALDAIRPDESLCISDLSSSGVALRLAFVLPPGGPAAQTAVDFLTRYGIEARKGYQPLHLLVEDVDVSLPATESLAERTLLIPISDRLLSSRRRCRALRKGIRGA